MSGQQKTQAESGCAQNATVPISTENAKPCKKCGATDRRPSDGRCRPCAKAWNAEHSEQIKATIAKWRAENPDYDAKYRAENIEKIRAYSAKYRAENAEQIRKHNAKWRAENPEQESARNAKYRAEHREQVSARLAKYRAENPAVSAKWRAEHPENKRATEHKRRARKRMAGGSFSAVEIQVLLKQQKKKCVVCLVDISKAYHIDHVMPLALGGHNGITNIQLLCPPCNMTKKDKHPVDFMQSKGLLL